MRPLLLIAFAIIAIAAFVVSSRKRRLRTIDQDIQVLAQLMTHGSDLTKPHSVDFFLYLPTEEAAQKAANQIQLLDFETEVAPPPEGYSTWGCKATKSMVPELATIKEIGANFTRIASSLNGQYDGWGTPIVK